MPEEKLTAEVVRQIVKDVLKEERDEFWVQQPQHFLDHRMLVACREGQEEWRKNHEFVSSVRSGAAWGRNVGIGTGVAALLSFIAGAIWLALRTGLGK